MALTSAVSLGVSGLGLMENRRALARWVTVLQLAGTLAFGIGGLAGPVGPWSVTTAFGPIAYRLTPWSAIWILVVESFLALAAVTLWARHEGQGLAVAMSWLGTATAAFLTAATPLALLLAWGLLALGGYGLVVSEARGRRTVQAGWAMLAMNEAGTAALLLGAILLMTGARVGTTTEGVAAALGIVGLGAKAGLFPFQVWLPLAEPEAPGAAAGVLSAVLSAVALVGVWRWLTWAPPPDAVAWGLVVFGLGGSLLAVIHAMIDGDFKRVLAYSTAEWMGLALALVGMTAVFIHHGLMVAASLTELAFFALTLMHLGAKSAAFTAAGWVERATGTRRFGGARGLFRASRPLGRWLVVAAVALMALPPSGGYVAEWAALESIFVGASSALRIPLIPAALAVALIGAGGATAILRWFGMLFLGPASRDPKTDPTAAETGSVAAGAVLAAVVGIGVGWWAPLFARLAPSMASRPLPGVVAPTFVHPAETTLLNSLGGRIFAGLPGTPGTVLFPGNGFTATSPWDLAWFAGLLVLTLYLLRRYWRRRVTRLAVRTEAPWAGSVPYEPAHAWTAAALTHPLRLAFAPVIGLERRRRPHATRGLVVETDTVDRLLENGARPLAQVLGWASQAMQAVQSGNLADYVTYALVAVVLGVVALRLWAGM